MNTWKQTLRLASLELKTSPIRLILCWTFLPLFCLIFLTGFQSYLDNHYMGYDAFFIILFSFAPYYFKSQFFQYRKVYDHLWASPVLLMQLQLPIPKNILVKSRLVIYLVYWVPFISISFLLFYLASDAIKLTFDMPTYITFFIIWFAISFAIGIILPASDVGDYVTTKTWIYYTIGLALFLLVLLLFFHLYLEFGIVAGTVQLAEGLPILSIILAILLILSSWKFWQVSMIKKMNKLDYM